MTDVMLAESLIAGALDYARRGWAVFPLAERAKRPRIPAAHPDNDPHRGCTGECGREGHGLYDATVETERIRDWWRRWPEANIGLRTGQAFDVVDVDGPEGLVNLVAVQAGREMSTGPQVETPRGWHLYHQPTGVGNKAGLVPGVDFRGSGGYVVAPPSVVGPDGDKPGGTYRWTALDMPEWVIAGADEPILPVPEWLLELLTTPALTAASTVARSSTTSTYGRQALEAECGRIALAGKGSRNDTLHLAACRMGQLIAGAQLDELEAVTALAMAAERCGLVADDGVKSVEDSIASGLRKGLLQPRRMAS